MKYLGIFLALGILFNSCARQNSENVTQDTIWAHYELNYDNSTDITVAKVTFRFNNGFGTKLQLSDAAQVLFDGELMEWQSALAFYELEIAGFQETGLFEYTDLDGNLYSNSVELIPIAFPADFDTIPRPGSFELFWEGDPIDSFESVRLWIDGALDGDAQTFFENDAGSESIVLNKAQLNALPEGIAEVLMDRTYSPPIMEATEAGGLVSSRYRSETIEVQID